MPHKVIDYQSPYTATSLITHVKSGGLTTARCVLVLYGGPDYVKTRIDDFACLAGTNEITSTEQGIFDELEAGDKIFVNGFDEDDNNGQKTVVSVSSDGTYLEVAETLVNDPGTDKTVSIRGGTAIAMTEHVADITFLNTTFKVLSGGETSAFQMKTNTEGSNLEATGEYTNDVFTRGNVLNSVYDNAFVDVFSLNYEATGMGRMVKLRGRLGKIKMLDEVWKAEFHTRPTKLKQEIGESYGPTCKAILGDLRCTKDLTNYIETGEIDFVADSNDRYLVTMDTPTTCPDHLTLVDYQGYVEPTVESVGQNWYDWWFKDGLITWLTGDNAGTTQQVDYYNYEDNSDPSMDGIWIELREPPAYQVVATDTFELTVGCNKTFFSHCQYKFNNTGQARAEPYLPGRQVINKLYNERRS